MGAPRAPAEQVAAVGLRKDRRAAAGGAAGREHRQTRMTWFDGRAFMPEAGVELDVDTRSASAVGVSA